MRKPNFCPKCGSQDIGQLDPLESKTDEEYEKLGGRWYCVSCGWGEDFPLEYVITCFLCGHRFLGYIEETDYCPKCGFVICPFCEGCRCTLTYEEKVIADRMLETVKPLLSWWLKQRGLQIKGSEK